MLRSGRAIFYHANSCFISNTSRSHNNYVSCLSSISHKNQGPKTPEELSRLYKTGEGSEVDRKTTRSGERSGGATNVTMKGVEKDPNKFEEAEETAKSVAETAKVAAVGAVETGLRIGKMAKQTVDGMWDATKETTENVRDSVADDIHNGRGRTSDIDHRIRIEEESSSSDKFVEELRRRAAGYDLKDDGR